MNTMANELLSLKDQGNEHFKANRVEDALSCYMKALEVGNLKDLEKAVVYKNKAACHLKMGRNKEAVTDASASLEIAPNDPKALFRRCQAYETLGKVDEAYKDAALLIKVDPSNKVVLPVFKRLNVIIQKKIKEQNSTTSKVSNMFNITFDVKEDKEKRITSMNNLVVLSRDDVGASQIIREGGLPKLKGALLEKDKDINQAAIRVLATLCKGSKDRCYAILDVIDLVTILRHMSADTEDMASSVALLVQNLISYSTGLHDYVASVEQHEIDKKKGSRQRYPQASFVKDAFLKEVFTGLVKMLTNAKVTGWGRDSAMELITKNVVSLSGADWTSPFLDTEGVENLLCIAGTQTDYKTLRISPQSHMHASVALSKIYDDLCNDKLRERFKEKCHEYFREQFAEQDYESKIEAVAAISVLFQGTYDVGSMILGLEGVVPLMFALCESDNRKHQLVAVECMVSSAQKKDRCSGLLKDAVPILKKLYQSPDDQIKVRALVGLCKLGSFGGTDASIQPMDDGSQEKLARICRKFLTKETDKKVDLHKWATEGLAYLTLSADIKEELVDDTPAIKAIFSIANLSDSNVTYSCVTVLVNLTNSYDKQDIMPELMELAKFSKQHVPEDHAKDSHEFISSRIHKLTKAGLTNALVALSTTESKNSRELISRVFLSISTEESLRGLLVQQGGVKALLNLQENNTEVGPKLAAHALAKVAVTQDPGTAFTGQKMYEMVRPLVSCLHVECSGLQNFEALMGLCNLASVSESVRNRILKEEGYSSIEQYMYDDHQMLRRASAECVCNMVMSDKVQDLYEGDNDKVKLLVLLCGEDDDKLVRAASGALAILSGRPKIAKKVVEVASWLDIFQLRAISEVPDLQHRHVYTLRNVMFADKDSAQKLVDSPIIEILMAVSKDTDKEYVSSQKAAQEALDKAVEWGLIEKNQRGRAPEGFLVLLRTQLRKVQEEEAKRIKEEEEEEERERLEEERQKKEAADGYQNKEAEANEEYVSELPELSEEIEVEAKPSLMNAKKQPKVKLVEAKPPPMEDFLPPMPPPAQFSPGPQITELTDEEAAKLEKEGKKVMSR